MDEKLISMLKGMKSDDSPSEDFTQKVMHRIEIQKAGWHILREKNIFQSVLSLVVSIGIVGILFTLTSIAGARLGEEMPSLGTEELISSIYGLLIGLGAVSIFYQSGKVIRLLASKK
ncbi:hypothetical protein [Reichenbachiella versicolor]|uniref:hypothetical protein n=1 Tax=Reichenbachiella versicolor TaxID=1821036 RepID=UPI000D6DFCAD|nr:hypothetical protein [Reichenbachiella versicolor]